MTHYLFAIAAVVFGASPALASSQYKVASDSSTQFVARITGGSFTGKTSAVTGHLEVADDNKVTQGSIVVKADALDTGMSMRDSHMKEKYLETSRYPVITLDLTGAALPVTGVGASDVAGVFEMHGVKKPITVHVEVSDAGGGIRRVKSDFIIDITDYGIAQPKFAVVKMDTKVDVSVDIRFAPAGP